MKRTPEPELMQSPSQVRAYADADFSKSDSMVIKSLEKYLTKVGKTLNKTDLIFNHKYDLQNHLMLMSLIYWNRML